VLPWLQFARSSNPEWLAVKCHILAFEVSLGCEIQLVKIVLDREQAQGALLLNTLASFGFLLVRVWITRLDYRRFASIGKRNALNGRSSWSRCCYSVRRINCMVNALPSRIISKKTPDTPGWMRLQ
jgi:hypothetical protein